MSNLIKFTNINHVVREELGLSWMEYGLADLIYHLSNNPKSDVPGWCYASKEWLADTLGVSRMQVHRMIDLLIEKGLVNKNGDTRYLKTSTLWYEMAINKDSNKMLHPVTKRDSDSNNLLHEDSNEMLHNINKDNTNNNIKEDSASLSLQPSTPISIIKRENKYKIPEDVTEADFQEIADHYNVPVAFVASKHEDMILWAAQLPDNKKLKGRNWRMTLMNWVKRDGLKIRKEASEHVSKRGIDARSIK